MNRRAALSIGALSLLGAMPLTRAAERLATRAAGAVANEDGRATDRSSEPTDAGPGRAERGSFYSQTLRRAMSFIVYLPPGYDAGTERFPTLYMLHGSGGDPAEWMNIGLFASADTLIRAGSIAPLLIVLPEGDAEYWVDHVADPRIGANGEKWGTYTAHEVVAAIDVRYRTSADQRARAIGGLSMGGHGAMQLAMNFPDVWSTVGAHSPSLRPVADAPTYLGTGGAFAARDPLSLIAAKTDVARRYSWWIDAGDADPWRAQAEAISDKLTTLDIPHEWRSSAGEHSWDYWGAHLSEYLAFYAGALASHGSLEFRRA